MTAHIGQKAPEHLRIKKAVLFRFAFRLRYREYRYMQYKKSRILSLACIVGIPCNDSMNFSKGGDAVTNLSHRR